MVQCEEPGPRSQALCVLLAALPPTCANHSPLWTPVFEGFDSFTEDEFQKSFKSSLTDRPSHLWHGMSFVCQSIYTQAAGPRTHRQALCSSQGMGLSCMPLRTLQNFHRKELGDKQRVTLNTAFSLTLERPFLPVLLDQNRCKGIIDD